MSKEFDLIIFGNGVAAFSAAVKASEVTSQGASIAMIGTGPLGGTCMNVGCAPSKYLLEASHQIYLPGHPKMRGLPSTKIEHDFSSIMEGLRSYVDHTRKTKFVDMLQNYPNVTVYDGLARFVDSRTVQITDQDGKVKDEITAPNVLIATGSHPTVPNIEGLMETGFLTSDSIWNIGSLPESIAIIGGGAIGLEIGQALLHFGSKVTIIEALDIILPQSEPEIGQALMLRLQQEGMNFYLGARVSSVGKESNGHKYIEFITHKGNEKIEVSEIIVATGRQPNTSNLNLEAAGVKTDGRGLIVTDARMKTTSSGIYAAGDCVSKTMFLETLAVRESIVAVGNMFGESAEINYMFAAWAVFTYPQVAGVGMTEKEFSKLKGSCSCRTSSLANTIYASITGETDGIIKITIDPETNKIVGMHIFAPNATDLIIEGAYSVRLGLTYDDIVASGRIFPSYSEGVKLGAQLFIRDVSKASCYVE
ncbi:mercury(II) reductase [Cuniculiplasma divulgatum]|uniref:Heavy metal reductase n=1 Tax=Cuniculiplasma divulgatum TaxID=1673428 RepID=A0A1N5W4I8_9ARCH|nr:mercury(II) reductase [Cuniculiplasma divulgatum]SIM79305.1 heavy metal reductase [Cuniculiplasma divulgatum]